MQKNTRVPNHKRAIARHFSRAAQTYNDAAFLEREIGSRLLDRLDFIKLNPVSILDLGGGTGFFSEQLAIRYPNATIFNLDLAEGMLQQAKTCTQSNVQSANIISLCGDADTLALANHSVDFIFSNCVFHWCYNPSRLFQEIHRVLKPEGLLLFSTLGPDTLKELRESFYLINSDSHVNNFMDMHLVGDALLQAKFLDPVMDMEQLVFTFPNLSRLIEDIKNSGSSYVLRENMAGLNRRFFLKTVSDNYNQFKLNTNKIPATIEIVYGHAWGSSVITNFSSVKEVDDYYRIPISEIGRP